MIWLGECPLPVAPVSTIAVWFGVMRGFGVLCDLGEGLGPGVCTGGLQRCAVEVEVELLPNLVLVLFTTTTALSTPPPVTSMNAKMQGAYLRFWPTQNTHPARDTPHACNWGTISLACRLLFPCHRLDLLCDHDHVPEAASIRSLPDGAGSHPPL